MGRLRAAVLIGVHLLIAAHIAHWLSGSPTLTPLEPSEAMAFSQRSYVNAGLVFFAAMILLTAFFGRWFCGWGCHVLALQDLCRHWLIKVGIRPKPLRSRWLAWIPTLAFAYMFLWPLVYRVWIGDSLQVQGTEFLTRDFWATFPGWIVGALTLLSCGFATVYFLGAKGFCTYACPYGAIFAAADKVAPMRIRVTDACHQCGHCTAVCSSNVRVHEEVRDFGMVTSAGCMKCMDCVSVCPNQALYFGYGAIPLTIQPRQDKPKPPNRQHLTWTEEAILLAAFVLAWLALRGLFGMVPFLMSLGVAAIAAYLLLTLWHLRRQPTVSRLGFDLRVGGQMRASGRVAVVAIVGFWLFLAYGGAMQVLQHQVSERVSALHALKPVILGNPESTWLPTDAQRAEIQTTADALLEAERFGGRIWYGNDAHRAWVETMLGHRDQALAYITRALADSELPQEMLQLQAYWLVRDGQTEAAEAIWRELLRDRPDLPEPYLALGLSLARNDRLNEASAMFNQGLLVAPNSTTLRYNAGLSQAMLGNLQQAKAQFERALALQPDYLEARENLAGLLASMGDFQAAAENFEKSITQSPNDGKTRVLYARVLLELGRQDAAREQLRRALELDPVNGEAWSLLQSLNGEP